MSGVLSTSDIRSQCLSGTFRGTRRNVRSQRPSAISEGLSNSTEPPAVRKNWTFAATVAQS